MLDQRSKAVCNVVNESVVDPLGCNMNKVLELMDASTHIVGMRQVLESKLEMGYLVSRWINGYNKTFR